MLLLSVLQDNKFDNMRNDKIRNGNKMHYKECIVTSVIYKFDKNYEK